MEDLKLPENAHNVIRSLDLSNKELKWTINHSEHRVCLSLIWTTKPKAKSPKNGVRHFRQDKAEDNKSSHARKNVCAPTPRDHTNGSSSPAGQSHAGSKQAILETDSMPPPGKKKRKRHKTPSQYRRDRRRWLDFKARKRSPAETFASPTNSCVAPSNSKIADFANDPQEKTEECNTTPSKQQIPHLEPLVSRTFSKDTHHNEISMRDLDPFYISPTSLPATAGVTYCDGTNADMLAGLESSMLRPNSPDSVSSTESECDETWQIMDKVSTAASYIATVNRITTTNPGVMTDHLLGPITKARNAYEDAKQTLQGSHLPAGKVEEAVQSLESAFRSMSMNVQSLMDNSCGAGICQ